MFTTIWLRYEQVGNINTKFFSILNVKCMLSINESNGSTGLLALRSDMQSKSCFSGRFRAVYFNNTPLGIASNAQREIKAAEEKAAANLRKESAELAVALAGRLLSENLDTEKNRQLIDGLINEV